MRETWARLPGDVPFMFTPMDPDPSPPSPPPEPPAGRLIMDGEEVLWLQIDLPAGFDPDA